MKVSTEKDFSFDAPELLFEGNFEGPVRAHAAYDISPNGDGFVMIETPTGGLRRINIILNFHEELERLCPTE